MINIRLIGLLTLCLMSTSTFAALSDEELSVWTSEAIVATYTYNYKNFLTRQRVIASYFTSEGWTAYSQALLDSKLPDVVQKNAYYVSAVPTYPPQIKQLSVYQWQASMPLLVIYKNPQYQQKQTLLVTINFMVAPHGQGVRGLSIQTLQSKVSKPPCQCEPSTEIQPSTKNE